MHLIGVSLLPKVSAPGGLDVGEPFASYSDQIGELPLPEELLAKARQWCRALQRQIWATWWAAVESGTQVLPGGVLPEADAVMVEAGLTVAAIQVLYEVFLSAYPRSVEHDPATSPWEVKCTGSPEGRAMSGLKLIRNGEMHAKSIVVPDIARVVGVTFEDDSKGYRIFPEWVDYLHLPVEVRDARFPPLQNQPNALGRLKTNQIHHDHYQSDVARAPVVEPLLDALAFVTRCDPRIVRMDTNGDPRHFPLEPISERDYERRHPDWKRRTVLEAELRDLCESNPPTGTKRVCIAHLKAEDGTVLAHCGYTQLPDGNQWIFTETPEQILRDVSEFNFPYWMEVSVWPTR
jgi:hypothetical protein